MHGRVLGVAVERLFQAIQARKLDRLAAAYAVGGWLLVQAASIALPAFDVPGWVLKALILFTLLGFPLTLTLGWMGARHLPGMPLATPRRPRAHLAAMALLGLVLVLATAEAVYRLSRQDIGNRAATAGVAISGPAPTSIAVLPFVNMSGDPKQDYFSDGISEELLNDLANIPELRVVARSSSFAFKGKNENIKSIARLLAVRSIVEGSVREVGEHLRIHAELINASSGYDLWSASFDRDLTDALALQDEIGRSIVAALTHKLLPKKAASGRPNSIDPEAYRAFLEAQSALGPRTQAGSEKAVALFNEALVRQPNFAEAYAGLARAYINVAAYHSERKELLPAAQAALSKALALDPKNLTALDSHLDLALQRMDWRTALADAGRLQSTNPHSQAVLHEMFRYYQVTGFPEEALHAAQGAAQLNRLSLVDRLNVAVAFLHLARWNEAAKAAEDALALSPGQPDVLDSLCEAYSRSNRLADARKVQTRLSNMREAEAASDCAFAIAIGEGNLKMARAMTDKLAAQFPHGDYGALDIGDDYAIAGAYPEAIKWLTRSYDQHEFTFFTLPYDRAIAPAFFQTRGWKALWQRPLVQQWQAAHDQIARDVAARSTG
ncbi:MAG TPA: hypothetical protein VGF62_08020 [Rhizomicrobium sp.]